MGRKIAPQTLIEQLENDALEFGIIRDRLLLASIDVPIDDIATWDDTRRIFAQNWAIAVHYSASDNVLNEFCRAHDEDANYTLPFRCICRPPRPDFLAAYRGAA